MIRGVLPTALCVSDLERSLRFYCDLMGLELARELPSEQERAQWDVYHERVCAIPGARIRVAYLRAPDGSGLELIEYLSPKASSPSVRRPLSEPGTSVVALAVEGSPGYVRRLRQAGVEVVSDPVYYCSPNGEESLTTYLYDPDGNALCLFETITPAQEG